MMDISERMQYMLDNQSKWSTEYKQKRDLYKLTKNRAEKARVKEVKRLATLNTKTTKNIETFQDFSV